MLTASEGCVGIWLDRTPHPAAPDEAGYPRRLLNPHAPSVNYGRYPAGCEPRVTHNITEQNVTRPPPATRDGESYSGELQAEASGNNRHHRAAVPEIREVYDGSAGANGRPRHLYEAQLMHYGLPPFSTKGTAKMRGSWGV